MQAPVSNSSLLVVIIDTNPIFWGLREKDMETSPNLIGYRDLMEQMVLYMNAYLMLHSQNRLAVISNHPSETKFLFPTSNGGGDDTQTQFLENIPNMMECFKNVAKDDQMSTTNSQFSAALSLALCYINRAKKETTFQNNIDYRILIIQGTDDAPSQYIPMMNCIFSAQKIGVLVDACVLSKSKSMFLQQATDLTNGSYLHLGEEFQRGILQHLFTVFLPDKETRKILNIPLQNEVDFRASCFCHRNTIDTGYVCSVCLSIFCSFLPICSTCGTKFQLPRLKKSKRKRKVKREQ